MGIKNVMPIFFLILLSSLVIVSAETDDIPSTLETTKQCDEFGYDIQSGPINYCDDTQNSYDLSVCSNQVNTCSDSDDGEDYFSLGQISFSSSVEQGDSCSPSSGGSGGGGGGLIDSCINSAILKEMICNSNGTSGYIEYNCPLGCNEGACNKEPTITTPEEPTQEEPTPEEPTSNTESDLWSWGHCSPEYPCSRGEGDCDLGSSCLTGYCAQNVGKAYGVHAGMDVCECPSQTSWNGSGCSPIGKEKITEVTENNSCEDLDCSNGCFEGACVNEENDQWCEDSKAYWINHAGETEFLTDCEDSNQFCYLGSCADYADESEEGTEIDAETGECNGCTLENKCYPLSYRTNNSYCDIEGFSEQKGSDATCNNNFECSSNLCIDNQCLDSGVWQKIKAFFSKLFG